MELAPQKLFVGKLTLTARVPEGIRGLRREEICEGMDKVGLLKQVKGVQISRDGRLCDIQLLTQKTADHILQSGVQMLQRNTTLRFDLPRTPTIDVSVMDAHLEFDSEIIKKEIEKFGELENWYNHEDNFSKHKVRSGIRVFKFNKLYRSIPPTLIFGGRHCRILYEGDRKHREEEKRVNLHQQQEEATKNTEEAKQEEERKKEQEQKEAKERKQKEEEERRKKQEQEEREKQRQDEEDKAERLRRMKAERNEMIKQHQKLRESVGNASCVPNMPGNIDQITDDQTHFDAEEEDIDMVEAGTRKRIREKGGSSSSDDGTREKREKESNETLEDVIAPYLVETNTVSPLKDTNPEATGEDLVIDIDQQSDEEGERIKHATPAQKKILIGSVGDWLRKTAPNKCSWNLVSKLLLELGDDTEKRKLFLLDVISDQPLKTLRIFLGRFFQDTYGALEGTSTPHVKDLSGEMVTIWAAWETLYDMHFQNSRDSFLTAVESNLRNKFNLDF